MSQPILYIGNTNYSSWSLRPWLLLHHYGVAMEVRRYAFNSDAFYREVGAVSPTCQVPCLRIDSTSIWDSLAICEWAAEACPEVRGWPEDAATRAVARSVSAEMHAGFKQVRSLMPMNVRRLCPKPEPNAKLEAEIARIQTMWRDLIQTHGGPFLFGDFLTIADAMYAPVVFRFTRYQIDMDPVCAAYADHMTALPSMVHWREAAHRETEVNEASEVAGERRDFQS
ncbi:glutathione S-transferase family protein [Acanthopleuribacter pedis]|uniref:Glutathione S-transferase family protein n=1 Tax=Acanthopleuribacter pedis TaxID=442870 RepID=A0A8J7U3F8_9BACT|nr:glutathione S-transferase family protein [Acanthopleuribacter pedis]MBO1317211.1 glutathione S-transferase family protein [Acanthopleuribacter pedis]MBO1318517.1 glutathione S-transferase family protein [Acanthopleuribacter pedis]